MPKADAPVAWVESPLQMIGAAEWAHAHGQRVDLAGRLAVQVEETASELTTRGALFGAQAGYYGIPWGMLRRHDHWLVGDGFSGQFRLAVALLRPRRITFLDDGMNAVAFADALTGAREYSRPGVAERGLTRRVAPLALDAVRLRAAAGAVDVFTAFPLGDERTRRLSDLGVREEMHAFEWLRATRPAPGTASALPHDRVILGSARVVDGHMSQSEYLGWVREEARRGAACYLPHRREGDEILREIERIDGVRIVRTGLPIEIVLAGSARPLEIATQRSSAAVTLRRVLAGTASVLRVAGARREVAR
ncbi:hypothetical protein [Microbacterium karelineae]|uniref:hypothetical protein n=1 Tax=Microbacterium karelineae TaxID=2654283 RepID=UPI0012E9FAA3|nr:hypothetical protein [Microbacterium karelineae]